VQHYHDDDMTVQLLKLLLSRGSMPGADELASLITMCLQIKADKCAAACIHLLCEDPAALQISVSKALLLLLHALGSQQPQAMLALAHRLSAVFVQLSSKQVAQLLLAAGNAVLDALPTAGSGLAEHEQEHWLGAMCAVIRLPAVHEIDAEVVAQLLAKATAQGAVQYLEQLLGIKSLRQLAKSTVASLLQLAEQQQQHACVRLLAGLPGAAFSLSAEQIMRLLQDSVQKDDHSMVVKLCGMHPAIDVKPHHIKLLLTAALRHCTSLEWVVPLCRLPAAVKLPKADIEELIKTAETALEEMHGAVERATGLLSPSQVAQQTVAAVTSSGQSDHRASPRVQLGVRVVAALKDLQAAAQICRQQYAAQRLRAGKPVQAALTALGLRFQRRHGCSSV
jgi:hypothetical protein